jgi:hypothetical protein
VALPERRSLSAQEAPDVALPDGAEDPKGVPRMSRRLTILISLLFVAWIGSVSVFLLFLASLVTTPALVAAIVVQVAVVGIGAALLLVTNTRRPAGIDPDAEPPQWGRRQEDKGIIETISDALESEAKRRPFPARTPDWMQDEAEVKPL